MKQLSYTMTTTPAPTTTTATIPMDLGEEESDGPSVLSFSGDASAFGAAIVLRKELPLSSKLRSTLPLP